MSNLKLYINGRPGDTSGTEVTELTFKNFAAYSKTNYDGVTYKNKSLSVLPVCLRMNSGYKATSFTIAPKLTDEANIWCGIGERCYSSFPSGTQSLNFLKVQTFNVELNSSRNVMIFFFIQGPVNTSVTLRDLFSISYIEEVV